MAEVFELFRVSALPSDQTSLLEKDLSREGYLRMVFGEKSTFSWHGTEYNYVPVNASHEEAILGRIGKPVVLDDNTPPEEGYEDHQYETNRAAVVLIDPREHSDGQKIAVQKRVGSPLNLLQSLVKKINEGRPNSSYSLEVQPIFDGNDFWEWAEKNEGKITSLTFDLIVPNGIWSTETDMKDELRVFHKTIGAEKVETTFSTKDAIKTNNKRIKDAVAYAEKGSGKIRARARGNKRFNSRNIPKKIILPTDKSNSEPILKRALARITEIFDRE